MSGTSGENVSGTPPEPPLDKEVVRLPDGRELTYYRFPEPARPPAPASPAKKRER